MSTWSGSIFVESENSPKKGKIHDYLIVYLPKQRNVSPNTILSYWKALEELLDYVKERKQVPLGSISFEHLTADTVFAFLEYLELEKGYSKLNSARYTVTDEETLKKLTGLK